MIKPALISRVRAMIPALQARATAARATFDEVQRRTRDELAKARAALGVALDQAQIAERAAQCKDGAQLAALDAQLVTAHRPPLEEQLAELVSDAG